MVYRLLVSDVSQLISQIHPLCAISIWQKSMNVNENKETLQILEENMGEFPFRLA